MSDILDSALLTLQMCAKLQAHVDEAAYVPPPREGENVVDYWIRVIECQAWDKGFFAVHGPPRNPYREASS